MNPTDVRHRLTTRLLPISRDVTAEFEHRHLRQAAVLILLYPRETDVVFPLTVRPQNLRRHAGQIALPGGGREPADRTLWHTALRETDEELGIAPNLLEPLGRLHSVPVVVGDYLIAPFVAWTQRRPEMRPQQSEVSEVLEVALRDLTNPSSLREETRQLSGSRWRVTYYQLAGNSVWGATARILGELVAQLRELTPEEVATPPGSVTPV